MTKIITGGTGLIGSAFNDGIKLTSKRDLRDYDKAKFAISSVLGSSISFACFFMYAVGKI